MISPEEAWMAIALDAARAAAAEGEVPVGAVGVVGGAPLCVASNRRELDRDPTAHAEMLVLRQAAELLGRWRLSDLTMVVTLEPCPMCAGALVNARVPRLIYGARDPKAGAIDTAVGIGRDPKLNHRFEVAGGVLEAECCAVLTSFFRARR